MSHDVVHERVRLPGWRAPVTPKQKSYRPRPINFDAACHVHSSGQGGSESPAADMARRGIDRRHPRTWRRETEDVDHAGNREFAIIL
jgi:hypothetical protein